MWLHRPEEGLQMEAKQRINAGPSASPTLRVGGGRGDLGVSRRPIPLYHLTPLFATSPRKTHPQTLPHL